MVLAHPGFLWILPIAVLPLVLAARREPAARTWRTIGQSICATIAIVLLILALARPIAIAEANDARGVLLLDLHASLSDADLAGVEKEVARVLDAGAHLVVVDDQVRRVADVVDRSPGWLARLRQQATTRPADVAPVTLGEALDVAGAIAATEPGARIDLYTDGRRDISDALAMAERLGKQGLVVAVHPVGSAHASELVLRSVTAPNYAAVASTITIEAEVEASAAGAAELIVTPHGRPERRVTRTIDVQPGRAKITVPIEVDRAGLETFEVELRAAWDTDATNNARTLATHVAGPYRVLVLEDGRSSATRTALTALLGSAAQVRGVDARALGDGREAFDEADLVVVGDVPADALSNELQTNLRREIEGGLGVIFTGGRQSYGPGGYAAAPIREVLPLDLTQQAEQRDPSVTLVVIIDTSGSMTGPRLALAKEVARLAIRRLQPHDKVGIVEFYGSKRWAARIQPAANAIDINRALNRLSAGGGTVVLPAFEEAYYALLNVQTRTKHVLVITDGGVETGPFQEIMTRMAEAGITVSTVMAGPGQHSAFLSSLAHWGGGQFYAAPDRFSLPEVLLKQPESVPGSPFVESPTQLIARSDEQTIRGIAWDGAPAVGGYMRSVARPTADVLLRSESGDPVLARWQFGLGQVVAWTSDLGGPWSEALGAWPGFAKLFSNLARQAASTPAHAALRIQTKRAGGGATIVIDPAPRAQVEPGASLMLSLTMPRGATRSWRLEPAVAGRWIDHIELPEEGIYELSAATLDGAASGRVAIVRPTQAVVSSVAPERETLERLAAAAENARRGASVSASVPVGQDLYPWMVTGALVLMLTGVLVRRWPLRVRAQRALQAACVMLAVTALGQSARAEQSASPPAASAPASAAAFDPAVLREAETLVAESQNAEEWPEIIARLTDAQSRLVEAGHTPSELLRAIAAQTPDRPLAARLCAYAAAQTGDFERARRVLERAIIAGGDDAGTWSDLARWLELAGEDEAALNALDVAIDRSSGAARTALQVRRIGVLFDHAPRATLERALRELVDAAPGEAGVAYVRRLAAMFDAPHLATSTAVATTQPSGAEALFVGALAMKSGALEQARDHLDTATSTLRSLRDRQFALQQRIELARRTGELGKLADEWLARPNLSADELRLLFGMLRELGRIDEALGLLSRAPSVAPGSRDATQIRRVQQEAVEAAIEAGRLQAAERNYRELIEAEPDNLDLRIALARILVVEGRRDAAGKLFEEAARRATSDDARMQLAGAAAGLSLDEVASAIAEKVAERGAAGAVRVGIWKAELLARRGRSSDAVAELDRLISVADAEPALLRQVADAFERLGQPQRAITLLQRVLPAGRDEDLDLKLAFLLEQTQQFEAAAALWRTIWEKSDTPAHQARAARRLLELAAKNGTVADLAIEIEEKLAENKANQRELSLLVDIYTQLEDPVSAGEVLFAFARQSGNEIDATRQLARSYLRMGRIAQSDALLRRLLELDPARSAEYLEELTVLAVERNRPRDAQAAITQLAALRGDDSTRDELSAGVLGMLNQHEEAARAYERVLTRYPDRVEVWLLWANAMRAAGRAAEAIARLQVLAEEAEQDDLFLVAVDGLLNLEAGRAPLSSVLRRIRERLAAGPEKMFLYDVAADVLESLGRPEQINPLMEVAVVFAGEQRFELLREMLERAKAAGDADRVVAYGNALVAADFNVPPQVLLDLGETLLARGDAAQAERAFARAAALGDYVSTRQRVADAYERAGLLERAERVVSELLMTDATNLSLLSRDATLLEQMGNFAGAFDRYAQAYGVLRGRLTALSDPGVEATMPASTSTRRPSVATNVDEITQFFDPTVDGLLTCARTDALRTRLLDLLGAAAEEDLAFTTQGPAAAVNKIARFPRLVRTASTYQRACFSLHAPDRADAFDRKLIERFPEDTTLRTYLVRQRLTWGLPERAARLADGAEGRAVEIRLMRVLSDAGALDAYLAGALDPALDARLIAALVMQGRDGDVRRVMDAALRNWKGAPLEPCYTMLIASAVLDDAALVKRWTERLLEGLARAPASARWADAVVDVLRVAWNLLPAGDRRELLVRLDELARTRTPRAYELDLVRLALDPELAASATGRALRLEMAKEWARDPQRVVTLLSSAPVDEQAALVEQAWTAAPADNRVTLLLVVAGGLSGEVDEKLPGVIKTLLEASPAYRLNRHTPYAELVRSGWHRNSAAPALGVVVADHLLGQLPREAAVQGAAACALATAGSDRVVEVGRRALAAVLADRKLEADQAQLIEDLARAFPPEERQAAARAARSLLQEGRASVVDLYVGAVMLLALDEDAEGLAMLRRAMRQAPSNAPVKRRLESALESERRYRELVEVFGPFVSDRAVVQESQLSALAEAHRQLGDPIGMLRVLDHDSGPLASMRRLQVDAMLGRDAQVLLRLRRYLATNRMERRFYIPLTPAPPTSGGLREYLQRQDPSYQPRTNLFAVLAVKPTIAGEFAAMLQAAPPDRRDVGGLIDAVLAGGVPRDALLEQLQQRLAEDTFDARDLRLLAALVTQGDVAIPREMLARLDVRVLVEPRGEGDAVIPGTLLRGPSMQELDRLEALARLHARAGDMAGAANIARWLAFAENAQSRRNTDARTRMRRWDLYLEHLPEASRADEARRLLRHSLLLPCEGPSDRVDAELFVRAKRLGDAELVSQIRETIQRATARRTASSFIPRLRQALVQDHLERGDLDGARQQLDELVRLMPAAYGDYFPLDCSQVLPAVRTPETPPIAAVVELVVQTLDEAVSARRMSREAAVRAMGLLAYACRQQEEATQATRVLERALQLAGGTPNLSWLWLIDVADHLGREADALRLTEAMLLAGRLPTGRVAEAFDRIEKHTGRARANQIAADVAEYCYLPVVLERALEHAARTGDPARAATWRERLNAYSSASGQ